MAKLSSSKRNNMSSSEFAFPSDRSYPINDKNHARNALARGAQHLSSSDEATLKRKVHKKYPDIEISNS